MGKETFTFRDTEMAREKRRQMSPVWRGVGCLLLVLMTAAGFWFAGWFMQANQTNEWVYLPPELVFHTFMPAWTRAAQLPPGMLVQLIVGFLFMVFGYGILSFSYAVLFPIQPGPTDVPTPKRRPRPRSGFRSRGR